MSRPGVADDDVGAARQIAVLDRIRRPAVDADRVDLEAATIADGLLGDLLRELARRRQHQDGR
jgi:hypothetical protein